ncbi:MAG: hypothetical protein IJC27_05750 [Lentisphaeria bacterium]|nr:hypothetical protein [Lentisphaeria bacterium]
MRKSLLVWGVLIALALCFVGCCYYTTTHCSPCSGHCHHKQNCNTQNCPANADDTVETMTVEAVEVIPVGNQDGTSGTPAQKAPAAAKKAPAPAPAPAPAQNAAPANN